MKKAVVVLSQKLQGNEYFKRLRKGINTYHKEKADYIVLLSESVNKKNLQLVEERGVPTEKILTEPNSKDTIGEVFLLKKNIVLPYNIRRIYVVSSDYHIKYRAKTIFDYVFETGIDIDFVGIKTNKAKNKKVVSDQLRSLQYFSDIIKHTKDDNLLANHPLYKEEDN